MFMLPTTGYPDAKELSAKTGQEEYKILRLQEMAAIWQGTTLEPFTVRLLAMLLVEDGTLTAERRHDCHNGVCFAIGIQGHHICHRGTPLVFRETITPYTAKAERYCTWKDGKSPQQRFEEDYPGFATEWRVQFEEYTLRMKECIEGGKTVNACVQSWNSREVGRIKKVASREPFVRLALGM